MFTKKFGRYACEGDTITCEVDGFDVTARIVHDQISGEPWKESDGHGPVSDWVRRGKRPGERVVSEDRDLYRYYDYEEAIKIAKRDGWDAPPYGGTTSEKAARAVERDYQAMKAWCDNEWFWCGIVLSVSRAEIELDNHAASLWGIECNYPDSDNEYLTDVANELLPEAIEAGKAALERLCKS